jgi:hypothetical protein
VAQCQVVRVVIMSGAAHTLRLNMAEVNIGIFLFSQIAVTVEAFQFSA